MSNRLGGKQGTSYPGTNAVQPPDWSFNTDRNPTIYDIHYSIGDLWLNKLTKQVWVLVSLAGNSTSKGEIAQWIEWGGAGNLKTLTGNTGGAVPGDAAKNINVVGDATTIHIAGNPGTFTLTASTDGSIATSYPTDAGTAIPAAGVLNVLGGTAARDINTKGAGNTIHVDLNNAITLGDLSTISPGSPSLTLTTGDLNMSGSNITLLTYQTIRVGGASLYFLYNNIFMGFGVGNTGITAGVGIFNLGIGAFCYSALTTGAENLALGQGAHQGITTGGSNVAIGYTSSNVINSGSRNIAIGPRSLGDGTAGLGLKTGIGNIAIGNQAGGTYNGAESYNILIGDTVGGTLAESNTLRIGAGTGAAASQLNAAFIHGIRGITTGVNDAIAVLIDSAGQLGTISSSIRYKENVEDMGSESDQLMKLRPVVFDYKETGNHSYGLIAEEVAETFPELVAHNAEGEIETVKYHLIVPMLLNEIQKLAKRIDILENR